VTRRVTIVGDNIARFTASKALYKSDNQTAAMCQMECSSCNAKVANDEQCVYRRRFGRGTSEQARCGEWTNIGSARLKQIVVTCSKWRVRLTNKCQNVNTHWIGQILTNWLATINEWVSQWVSECRWERAQASAREAVEWKVLADVPTAIATTDSNSTEQVAMWSECEVLTWNDAR